MPAAVLDSSVLVSAFLAPNGTPASLLAHARQGAFSLVLSIEILDETARALLRPRIRSRYSYGVDDVEQYRALLGAVAMIVADVPAIPSTVRDPNDDKILACAQAANAAYLVTGDNDLLTLGDYSGIKIVTPRQFLEALEAKPR
jgi:uncharacterized protein